MALVLRKAVLPKNVSLLKCIKGRTLVTATNKNNPTPLPAGAFRCSVKEAAKLTPLGQVKMVKMTQPPALPGPAGRHSRAPRRCFSCPDLVPVARTRTFVPQRHISPPRTRPLFYNAIPLSNSLTVPPLSAPKASFLTRSPTLSIAKRGFACKPSGPCPPCCGSCGCLPPPCNTPPKCIQYITGYYYYPYGTWFCGPYHVSGLSCCTSSGCCGCGCGPCGKCCACCITPAAAALLPMTATAPLAAPSPPTNVPLRFDRVEKTNNNREDIPPPVPVVKDTIKNARSSLSKFFPFNNTSATLGGSVVPLPKNDTQDLPHKLWVPFDHESRPVKVSASNLGPLKPLSGTSPRKWQANSSYARKANFPPHRKYSRCAADSALSKVSLAPIRHKRLPKQYIWQVYDGSRTNFRRDNLDDFKPYDA